MSRRVTLPCDPPMTLLTVSERDGVWEKEWEPLRGHPIASLFSRVRRQLIDDAIRGHEAPLLSALGIAPEGALRKLPSRECGKRKACTLYSPKTCQLLHPKMPWCLIPEGLDVPEEVEPVVMELVGAWRERLFVVVVEERT